MALAAGSPAGPWQPWRLMALGQETGRGCSCRRQGGAARAGKGHEPLAAGSPPPRRPAGPRSPHQPSPDRPSAAQVAADGGVYLLWCGAVQFPEDRGRRPETPTCVIPAAAAAAHDEPPPPPARHHGGGGGDTEDDSVRAWAWYIKFTAKHLHSLYRSGY